MNPLPTVLLIYSLTTIFMGMFFSFYVEIPETEFKGVCDDYKLEYES